MLGRVHEILFFHTPAFLVGCFTETRNNRSTARHARQCSALHDAAVVVVASEQRPLPATPRGCSGSQSAAAVVGAARSCATTAVAASAACKAKHFPGVAGSGRSGAVAPGGHHSCCILRSMAWRGAVRLFFGEINTFALLDSL